ncbi:hypothetical protein BDW69DRAFT_186075 [Aspergillus filifer]
MSSSEPNKPTEAHTTDSSANDETKPLTEIVLQILKTRVDAKKTHSHCLQQHPYALMAWRHHDEKMMDFMHLSRSDVESNPQGVIDRMPVDFDFNEGKVRNALLLYEKQVLDQMEMAKKVRSFKVDEIPEPVTQTLLRLRSTVLTTNAKVQTALAANSNAIKTYNEFNNPLIVPLHLWDSTTESNPLAAITRLRAEIGWSEEQLQAYLLRVIEECTKYADLLIQLD